MQLLKIALCMVLSLAIWGCRPGKVYYDRPQMDPEVEAEVKRINLERFAGSWLLSRSIGTIYLDISADGYYLTAEDSKRNLLGGDEGEIVHTIPGSMILYSYRDECEFARHGLTLSLDRHGDEVRSRDGEGSPMLVAVDKRERLVAMPCIPQSQR